MNPKIADVQILVDDTVTTLDQHERLEPDAGLTGGHLKAQKRRFERLWRVLIAARPDVFAAIKTRKMYPVLVRAIESLILGRCPAGVTLAEQSESIAHELGALQGWATAVGGIAARGAEFVPPYPTGAPALSSFFEPRPRDRG